MAHYALKRQSTGTVLYRPRRVTETVLREVVSREHLETFLALTRTGDPTPIRYRISSSAISTRCSIVAQGSARARCGGCGPDFLIAFSCKGRVSHMQCTPLRPKIAAHLAEQAGMRRHSRLVLLEGIYAQILYVLKWIQNRRKSTNLS